MPRFTQFEPPAVGWPQIRPAGQLRIIPAPDPCTLPTNPRAGQPGVNDPYFASQADRTAWISANGTCTPPPPFLADSPIPTGGQIKIDLTPPAGVGFPADLVVSVDGAPVTASPGGYRATGLTYLATGLADGTHIVKVAGTGIQPVSGPVTTVSGTTIGMPLALAPASSAAPPPASTPDCATAYTQFLSTYTPPITYQGASIPGQPQPPDTSAYYAFATANPSCNAWAGTQASNIMQQWQRSIVPVPPVAAPPAAPAPAGISWGTVLITGLIVGGVGYAVLK